MAVGLSSSLYSVRFATHGVVWHEYIAFWGIATTCSTIANNFRHGHAM